MSNFNYSFMFYLGTNESTENIVNRAFGPGFAELLKGIDESGSLYSSAKKMGMSYSKAWTILNSVESSYGVRLVERNGQRGSSLTDEAYKLLKIYNDIVKDVEKLIDKKLSTIDNPF